MIETEQPVEYSVEPTFKHSDREAIFYTSRYPYYEDGELAGTLAICRNVTDLEERTRQLHVLDNILRHNIRNELNVIHGRGEQLQRNLEGEPKAAAGTIVDRAETLLTTSEKSREITTVLSDSQGPTSVDIGQVVRVLAKETADEWPNADVDVTGPTQLVVSAAESITAAIEELLTNAVIHNDSEKPCVRVNLAVEGSWGTLSVRDNGPGIPEFDRDVLESGGAIETLSHGSGLGLWLVYWTVNHSGGKINVDEREPRGTEITIWFPLETGG
ncbi:HAMP domain-containing histidine kinase [Halorubrum sp. 2020YC2]|nr:HAMP domain-containing histidine kinase [Halorubrum sp. 2020YC2]